MLELTGLVKEMRDIHDGDAYHGPSLKEALDRLTPEQAAARPLPNAHSIWEIVNHIAGWENVWRLRLKGDPNASEPEEGDFPEVTEVSAEAWQATLSRVNQIHDSLIEMVAALTPDQLYTNMPNREYTRSWSLHGAVRHHVYHVGQIALLRKAFTDS